jgi:hypothetical protein
LPARRNQGGAYPQPRGSPAGAEPTVTGVATAPALLRGMSGRPALVGAGGCSSTASRTGPGEGAGRSSGGPNPAAMGRRRGGGGRLWWRSQPPISFLRAFRYSG